MKPSLSNVRSSPKESEQGMHRGPWHQNAKEWFFQTAHISQPSCLALCPTEDGAGDQVAGAAPLPVP